MVAIKRFVRSKWNWALENPLFWANVTLALISAAFVFFWRSPVVAGVPSDFRIRTWGMVLQLLGAYTVWHDLTSTARSFGKGNFMRHTFEWLKAAFSRRTVIFASTGMSSGGASSRARMKLRWPVDETLQLEIRVAKLEANFTHLDADVDNLHKEIGESAKDLNSKIRSEANTRAEALQQIEARLADAMTGNISFLAFGAFWIFIGIALSTMAPEIAKLAAGQWRTVLDAM